MPNDEVKTPEKGEDPLKCGYSEVKLADDYPNMNRGSLMNDKMDEIRQGILGMHVMSIAGSDGPKVKEAIGTIRPLGGHGEHY